MTRQDLSPRVIQIVEQHTLEKCTEASLLNDLDSLDMAEMAIHIVEEFKIDIENEEFYDIVRNTKTVGQLVDFVCKKQNIKPIQKQAAKTRTSEIEKLKGLDLSKLAGKPVQLNGYKIIVEKIAETKQIKR